MEAISITLSCNSNMFIHLIVACFSSTLVYVLPLQLSGTNCNYEVILILLLHCQGDN